MSLQVNRVLTCNLIEDDGATLWSSDDGDSPCVVEYSPFKVISIKLLLDA